MTTTTKAQPVTLGDDEPCATCQDTGYEVCPHDDIDTDGWCRTCDQPQVLIPGETLRILCRTCHR